MAPRLTELCELFVGEKLGDCAANVFSTLAHHGRLILPDLQRKTAIPIHRLRSVVANLITHNIVLWHLSEENDLCYFQVDWHAAYVLGRQEKITRLVEARHGKAAQRLLQDILERGRIEVGVLEDEQYFDLASPRDSGIGMMDDQASEDGGNAHGLDSKNNGAEQITSLAVFYDTLRTLLADGFLCKGTAQDHIPAAELEEQLRTEVIVSDPRTFKDGKTTGPKTAAAFIQAANSLKRKWQDEAEYSPHRDVASQGSIKRAKTSASGSNKRRKVDSNLTNGFHNFHDDDEDEADSEGVDAFVQKLPSDMWLRVNCNKCMVALRTERLEKLAEQYLGTMSAAVYGALLRAAEGKAHSVRSQLRVKEGLSLDDDGEALDNSDIKVGDMEILERLEIDLDLASTIKDTSGATHGNSLTEGTGKNNKKRRFVPDEDEDIAATGVKREVDSDDEDVNPIVNGVETTEHRQKRLNLIGMHLELLGESPKNFLARNPEKRTSAINFHQLSNLVAEAEVDQMVLARSGKIGLRVVRILREKGKLLDTQIASMCLKRLKDLRAILTNLQYLGFVDVQEMPRDQYRQPSKTVYLWRFSEFEVRQMFLQQSYQGISRTMLRLRFEQYRNSAIIDKAESVDWNLQRLNKPERDLLARWQATEERLTNTILRLDDVVMVLRDFDEGDTSLLG